MNDKKWLMVKYLLLAIIFFILTFVLLFKTMYLAASISCFIFALCLMCFDGARKDDGED